MLEIINHGVHLVGGRELIDGTAEEQKAKLSSMGLEARDDRNGTIAYSILNAHNTKPEDEKMRIKFDSLISHDITYVGIIQTARASGLKQFPIPYALTNCHNSLCAVGGTINEDDHVFGLSAAKKYGGIYVPANQAVIHQYAREMMSKCGNMLLGSDSHTRYGALGTMGVGEGGPELVKQLLKNTWDVNPPQVVLVYLENHLSGTVLMLAIGFVMLFLGEVKYKWFIAAGGVVRFSAPAADGSSHPPSAGGRGHSFGALDHRKDG